MIKVDPGESKLEAEMDVKDSLKEILLRSINLMFSFTCLLFWILWGFPHVYFIVSASKQGFSSVIELGSWINTKG